MYASTKKVKGKIEKQIFADPVKRLPHELNLIIFSYLKNADLGSCTKICSGWKNIVNSPELLRMTMDKGWIKRESIGSMLGRRISVLKEQGYTDQQIKWRFENEYRQMKGGLPWLLP